MNRISGGFEADRGQGEKRGSEKKRRRIFQKKKGSLGDGRGRSPIAIKIQTEDREKKGMRIRKGEEVIRLPFLLHEEEEEARFGLSR